MLPRWASTSLALCFFRGFDGDAFGLSKRLKLACKSTPSRFGMNLTSIQVINRLYLSPYIVLFFFGVVGTSGVANTLPVGLKEAFVNLGQAGGYH
jgi:hypothetical protein